MDLSQKTKDEIKNAAGRGFNVTASASEGTVVNEVTEETVQSTATKMDKLTLDAGKNIKLTHKKGKVLSVAVSDTPTFINVTTTGDLNGWRYCPCTWWLGCSQQSYCECGRS